jgi:hypothetical protein
MGRHTASAFSTFGIRGISSAADSMGAFAFCSPPPVSSVVAVLLFCQCGSDRVDVSVWNGSRARLRCLTCSGECWLDGFTVSEFDAGKLLTAALVDQARKHRKRSPDEIAKVQSQRALNQRR